MSSPRAPEPAPDSARGASGISRYFQSDSPLLRYLLVFGVGALIGLVLFGWILFPVRWTGTLPSDLRSDVQEDYLRLVADTYAASGDLPTAVERLKYWSPNTTDELTERLAARLEATGDDAGAERLRAVAQDTNLVRLYDGEPPEGVPTPGVGTPGSADSAALAPAAGEEGSGTGSGSNILNLFLYLFAALLVLALLVIVARTLHVPILSERLGGSPPPGKRTVPPRAQPAPRTSGRQPAPSPGKGQPQDSTGAAGAARTTSRPQPTPPPSSRPVALQPVGYEVDDDFDDFDEDARAVPAVAPTQAPQPASPRPAPYAAPGVPARPGAAIEVFAFTGDPNYNDVREISHRGEYMGEYGMGAGQGGQDNPDATYGMEVWLFDKSDIRTVTAVLLPPGLFNDEEMRSQVAGPRTPVLLANGAPIHLHTNQLTVDGRVRKVVFGRPDGEGTPIQQLEIELSGHSR